MILYLIQVATVFSVLYLLYNVFLKKLTFHNVNRLVLLLILPVSLIIPFSNTLFPTITSKLIEVPLFEQANLNIFNQPLQVIEQPLIDSSFNYSTVLITIYWLVFSVSLLDF